jgi:hypothetical protein
MQLPLFMVDLSILQTNSIERVSFSNLIKKAIWSGDDYLMLAWGNDPDFRRPGGLTRANLAAGTNVRIARHKGEAREVWGVGGA